MSPPSAAARASRPDRARLETSDRNLDLQGCDSTATAETEPGPPRLWASPMLAPATCILPARPSSWSWTLLIIRMPEEPMGWPQDLSPPDVFTGNEPPSLVSPACTARQPV